jgi:hypothetical protein
MSRYTYIYYIYISLSIYRTLNIYIKYIINTVVGMLHRMITVSFFQCNVFLTTTPMFVNIDRTIIVRCRRPGLYGCHLARIGDIYRSLVMTESGWHILELVN